jgi:predicted amidohydrolase YtcJ
VVTSSIYLFVSLERAVELVTALQQKGSSCSSPDGQLFKRRHILEGMQLCVGVGLTTVQTNDDYAQVAYKGLQSDSLLPLRVFLTPMHEELYRSADAITDSPVMPFRPPSLSNRTLTVNPSIGETELDASTQTSRLLVERLKIFSDGSLGAETAALRVPAVEGRSSATSKGVLINSRAALTAMICDASRAGFRVEVHAIGDAAAEHVLDCLEDSSVALMTMTMTTEETECTKEDPPSTARIVRPVLTHCQVLGADLIQRMNLLGAIANIQPSFVPTGERCITTASHHPISNASPYLLLHRHGMDMLAYQSLPAGVQLRVEDTAGTIRTF